MCSHSHLACLPRESQIVDVLLSMYYQTVWHSNLCLNHIICRPFLANQHMSSNRDFDRVHHNQFVRSFWCWMLDCYVIGQEPFQSLQLVTCQKSRTLQNSTLNDTKHKVNHQVVYSTFPHVKAYTSLDKNH